MNRTAYNLQKPKIATDSAHDLAELTGLVGAALLDAGRPTSEVCRMIDRVRRAPDPWDALATLIEYCDLQHHNRPL